MVAGAGVGRPLCGKLTLYKERNCMNIRLYRSPLSAHIAMMLALTLVLGSFTAFAGKRPPGGGGGGSGGGGTTNTAPKPPTPINFRVTGVTAYTIRSHLINSATG